MTHRSLSAYYEEKFAKDRAAKAAPPAIFITDPAWLAAQVQNGNMAPCSHPEFGEGFHWVSTSPEPHRTQVPENPSDPWPDLLKPSPFLALSCDGFDAAPLCGPPIYIPRDVALRRHWQARVRYMGWLSETNKKTLDLLERIEADGAESEQLQAPGPDVSATMRDE